LSAGKVAALANAKRLRLLRDLEERSDRLTVRIKIAADEDDERFLVIDAI
jgi:hypothetical protein